MNYVAKTDTVQGLLALLRIQGLVYTREKHFRTHMLGGLTKQQVHPVVMAFLYIHIHDQDFNKDLRNRQVHLVHILRNRIKHIITAHRHQGVLRLDHLDLRSLGKRCRQKLDYVFGAQMLELDQQRVVGRLHLVRSNKIHAIPFPEGIVRTAEQVFQGFAHGNPSNVGRNITLQLAVDHRIQVGLRHHLAHERC